MTKRLVSATAAGKGTIYLHRSRQQLTLRMILMSWIAPASSPWITSVPNGAFIVALPFNDLVVTFTR
jgi:hypothetical protein